MGVSKRTFVSDKFRASVVPRDDSTVEWQRVAKRKSSKNKDKNSNQYSDI